MSSCQWLQITATNRASDDRADPIGMVGELLLYNVKHARAAGKDHSMVLLVNRIAANLCVGVCVCVCVCLIDWCNIL